MELQYGIPVNVDPRYVFLMSRLIESKEVTFINQAVGEDVPLYALWGRYRPCHLRG